MLLDLFSLSEIIAIIIILLFIFGFFAFKWFLEQIREICQRTSGYLIFVQLIFVFVSCSVFLVTFFYYLIFSHSSQVDTINIFLTVVVGFMGTIMGVFFSERTIEKTIRDLEGRNRKAHNNLKKIKRRLSEINELFSIKYP